MKRLSKQGIFLFFISIDNLSCCTLLTQEEWNKVVGIDMKGNLILLKILIFKNSTTSKRFSAQKEITLLQWENTTGDLVSIFIYSTNFDKKYESLSKEIIEEIKIMQKNRVIKLKKIIKPKVTPSAYKIDGNMILIFSLDPKKSIFESILTSK